MTIKNNYYHYLLRRINYIEHLVNESKQVGELYHVCSLEAYLKYIKPNNELKASGNFNNWLHNGDTNYISFTRNKRYVPDSIGVNFANVLIQLVIDGDKLSNNYKIEPYNDFAFDSDGKINNDYSKRYGTESEEIVKGPIKNISKYIKEIRFDIFKFNNETINQIRSKMQNEQIIYFNFNFYKTADTQHSLHKYGIKDGMSPKQFINKIDSFSTGYDKRNNNDLNDVIYKYMPQYISNLDYKAIDNLLSNIEYRNYFNKYGDFNINKLLNLYRNNFDYRTGKCKNNDDIIKVFKAILDNGVDLTKFTYYDSDDNECSIIKKLPKWYDNHGNERESELAMLIKKYI